ncbi:MAG: MCE family protein [Cyanobacteria bacterium NC_groundwater_1444_Ag_S-0.65um_54_12]|nr:MCE family protein [Cyanobacteria bacterium NC_groundwater_1444_Ag_S-0.65um_54_12]
MKTSPATKVGLVTALGAVLLVLSLIWLTRYQVKTTGYRFKLVYSDVNGLTPGASVLLMGVRVGRVLTVVPQERTVLVECLIEDNATKIYQGSRFKIYSKGLIGEKALEIFPPTEPATNLLSSGAFLRGDDPVRLDTTFEAADQAVKSIGRYIDSPQTKATFQRSLEAVQTIFAKLDTLSEHLDQLVIEAEQFVAHGKQLAGTVQEKDMRAMVEDLRFLTGGLRQSYQSLLGSPDKRNAAQEAMDSLARLSGRLDHVAGQIDAFTSDPKQKADLADIVKQTQTQLASFQGQEGGKIPAFSPRLELQGITQSDVAQTPANLNTLSGNLSLRLGVGETAFVAGAEELGQNTLFTLTWGLPQFFAPSTGFHLGLIRSKMGMGIDFVPLAGTEVRAELFDPVRTQVRLSALLFPDFLGQRYGISFEWIQSLKRDVPEFSSARVGIQWRPLD